MADFLKIYDEYLVLNPKFKVKGGGMPTNDIPLFIDNIHEKLENMDTLDDFVQIVQNDLVCILLSEDDLLRTYLKVILRNYEKFSEEDHTKLCEIFYHIHYKLSDVKNLLSEI